MSPSFLTSVLALVAPGRAGTAQLQEKGQLEEAPGAQIKHWLCLSAHGEWESCGQEESWAQSRAQNGRMLAPRTSARRERWLLAPAGAGQDGGTGCRAGPRGGEEPLLQRHSGV